MKPLKQQFKKNMLRKKTNLEDIPDRCLLIALQVKGHPLSQLLMNGPEAVGLRLEHILHREKGKGGQRYLVKAVCFNDLLGIWIRAILGDLRATQAPLRCQVCSSSWSEPELPS